MSSSMVSLLGVVCLVFAVGGSGFALAEEEQREVQRESESNAEAYEQALQEANKTRHNHQAFERELYDAQRERFALKQSDDDRQRLAESRATVDAAFAQAKTIAGEREAVALQKFKVLKSTEEHKSEYWQAQAAACGKFADEFPYSDQAGEMMKDAFFAHLLLGRSSSSEPGPKLFKARGVNNRWSMAAEHQLVGLRYLAEYNSRFPTQGTTGGSTSLRYREEVTRFYEHLPMAEQVAEVHARYGLTYDERPDLAPHSDFLRLDYLAHKKDQAGFIKLLGQMQSRWKPDDPHWQTTSADALRQLCDLVQSDPRGTNFYWWLRGKREIGSLP